MLLPLQVELVNTISCDSSALLSFVSHILLLKGILLLLLAMKDRLNICLLLDLNNWVQLLLLVLLLLPQVGPEEWWIQIWIVIEM